MADRLILHRQFVDRGGFTVYLLTTEEHPDTPLAEVRMKHNNEQPNIKARWYEDEVPAEPEQLELPLEEPDGQAKEET